jgi:hypothetical protein
MRGAGGIMRILTLGYCSNILNKKKIYFFATRLLWYNTLLELFVETQKKKIIIKSKTDFKNLFSTQSLDTSNR